MHFPPGDSRHEGVSSLTLLREVAVGDALEGVDQEAVTRYPEGTRDDEKEIRLQGAGALRTRTER